MHVLHETGVKAGYIPQNIISPPLAIARCRHDINGVPIHQTSKLSEHGEQPLQASPRVLKKNEWKEETEDNSSIFSWNIDDESRTSCINKPSSTTLKPETIETAPPATTCFEMVTPITGGNTNGVSIRSCSTTLYICHLPTNSCSLYRK
jgi:hypothetical protein